MCCAEPVVPKKAGPAKNRAIRFQLFPYFSHSHVAALVLLLSLAHPSSAAALGGQQVHWTLMGQTAVTLDWAGPDSVVSYGPTTAYGQSITASTPNPVP